MVHLFLRRSSVFHSVSFKRERDMAESQLKALSFSTVEHLVIMAYSLLRVPK